MGISIRKIGIVRVVGTTNEFWITAGVTGDNGDAILVFKVDGIVVATVPILVRDNSGVWSIRKILTTREKTVCVNDFCVTNPIFYEYPKDDTTQPPVPIGGTGKKPSSDSLWIIGGVIILAFAIAILGGKK